MARINPAGLAQLQARLAPRALRAAEAAAEVLKAKLEGAGSGRQYPSLPNRSSNENEYPAEQSGELARSIQARISPGRPGFAEFGSIDGPAYAAVLHFKPPDAGGRPFMNDAQHDRDIHAAILKSMKGGG
ncbi:hypothetical protein [Deinococcus altitudinis]|uniref:hypothetical protein n=1 Tax=Deinococcus altitudinis TaxID=468914 RepID=UPI003891BC50